MGSPARVKEELSEEKLSQMILGNQAYVNLAREYRQQGLGHPGNM
jgi:carbonic anhydrase/acetyltransferase-like protein (isoleucine patch superfamily)